MLPEPPPPAPTRSLDGADPAVATVPVRRLTARDASGREAPDAVAVEAPLEVRFGGKAATVLLRTPGHDDELVRGFLLTEGLVLGPDDIVALTRPEGLSPETEGHVVDVALYPSPDRPEFDRPLYSSSSCGACGKRSLAALEVPAGPVTSALRVSRATLSALPARLREAQSAFERTGGLHAAGLFSADGRLLVLREDVGRHNAVDKVLGWALVRRLLPLSDHVLQVSGRISFELAQKAVVAGVPVLAAVGAPSSLAIDVARRHGLTLVGFVRPESLNVYSAAERVLP